MISHLALGWMSKFNSAVWSCNTYKKLQYPLYRPSGLAKARLNQKVFPDDHQRNNKTPLLLIQCWVCWVRSETNAVNTADKTESLFSFRHGFLFSHTRSDKVTVTWESSHILLDRPYFAIMLSWCDDSPRLASVARQGCCSISPSLIQIIWLSPLTALTARVTQLPGGNNTYPSQK